MIEKNLKASRNMISTANHFRLGECNSLQTGFDLFFLQKRAGRNGSHQIVSVVKKKSVLATCGRSDE